MFISSLFQGKNDDQVYSNTRVSTRVNTNQHQSTQVNTNQHESTRVRHESTRVNTSPTRINTSQHESKTSNDLPEAATRGVLCKEVFLEISQNSKENTCARASFLINFIKKEALAQVFSCEFCEISQNTFFAEHLWTTASNLRPFCTDTSIPLSLATPALHH